MTNGKATILLAEDEETDAYFVEWAMRQCGLSHQIAHVMDGQEAVDYLTGKAPFDDRKKHPLPDLILLDLKMPRLDGFDVLTWIKGREEFKNLPVVVLTSSQHPADMERARALGAAEYFVKPGNPKLLEKIILDLNARWLTAVPAK